MGDEKAPANRIVWTGINDGFEVHMKASSDKPAKVQHGLNEFLHAHREIIRPPEEEGDPHLLGYVEFVLGTRGTGGPLLRQGQRPLVAPMVDAKGERQGEDWMALVCPRNSEQVGIVLDSDKSESATAWLDYFEADQPMEDGTMLGWIEPDEVKVEWWYQNAAGRAQVRWISPTGIPTPWLERLRDQYRELRCEVSRREIITLEPEIITLEAEIEDGRLVWSGHFKDVGRPPSQSFRFPDGPPIRVEDDGTPRIPDLATDMQASLHLRQLLARIQGLRRRLVSDEDTKEPIALLATCQEHRALPCELEEGQLLEGLAFNVTEPKSGDEWLLEPLDKKKTLADVRFQSASVAPPDQAEEPDCTLHRVSKRALRLAWRVSKSTEPFRTVYGVLSLSDKAGRGLDPRYDEDAYARAFWRPSITVTIGGSDESLACGTETTRADQPLYLGPKTWEVLDVDGARHDTPEILGSIAGKVRWHNPPPSAERDPKDFEPTRWVQSQPPVLIVDKTGDSIASWGVLYAPTGPIPQDALRLPAFAVGNDVRVYVPSDTAAVWVYLSGLVKRFVHHPLTFGGLGAVDAWIGAGFDVFPDQAAALIGAVCPIHAQRSTTNELGGAQGAHKDVAILGTTDILKVIPGLPVRYATQSGLFSNILAGNLTELEQAKDACTVAAGMPNGLWIAVGQHAGPILCFHVDEHETRTWRFHGFWAERGAGVPIGKDRKGWTWRLVHETPHAIVEYDPDPKKATAWSVLQCPASAPTQDELGAWQASGRDDTQLPTALQGCFVLPVPMSGKRLRFEFYQASGSKAPCHQMSVWLSLDRSRGSGPGPEPEPTGDDEIYYGEASEVQSSSAPRSPLPPNEPPTTPIATPKPTPSDDDDGEFYE